MSSIPPNNESSLFAKIHLDFVPILTTDTTASSVESSPPPPEEKKPLESMTTDEKITQVAKPLKNQNFAVTVKDFFQKIFTHIKSGLNSIAKCFKEFLFDDDDFLVSNENSDYKSDPELERVKKLSRNDFVPVHDSVPVQKKESKPAQLIVYDQTKVAPTQSKPVQFINRHNNCWFHAALALINALGDDFFDLVENKCIEIDAKKNDIAAYDIAKKDYEDAKKLYNLNVDAYNEYQVALTAYEATFKVFEGKHLAMLLLEQSKYAAQLENQVNWSQGDSTTPPPPTPSFILPEEDKPEPPALVKKPGKRPIEPKEVLRSSEVALVKALKDYKVALDTGDNSAVKQKAQIVHDRLIDLSKSINSQFGFMNKQEDPAEFLDIILGILSEGVFQSLLSREGTIDGKKYYNKPKVDMQNKLEIQFPTHKDCNLQEMVDGYFETEIFLPTSKDPHMQFTAYDKKGVPVDGEDNTMKFKSVKSSICISDPAPEFFILQSKRFSFHIPQVPSTESMIKDIIERTPKKWDSNRRMEHGIKEYNSMLKRQETSSHSIQPQKINKSIAMPKNGLINMAKAFGKSKEDEGYEYQITSVIFHEGNCGGGHYTAAVQHKDSETGENVWSEVNDMRTYVSTIKPENVADKLAKGYIFLLRKVKKLEQEIEEPDEDVETNSDQSDSDVETSSDQSDSDVETSSDQSDSDLEASSNQPAASNDELVLTKDDKNHATQKE